MVLFLSSSTAKLVVSPHIVPPPQSKLVVRLEAGGLGGEVDVLGVEGHDVALGIGHGRRADGDTADDGILLAGSHCLVLVDRPHIIPSHGSTYGSRHP